MTIQTDKEKRSAFSDMNIRLNGILARERKKQGLTQEALGEMIDRSQPFVARYERNQTVLNALELKVICDALEYPIERIFDELDSWMPEKRKK